MKYRALKVSNVEEYLSHGIGTQTPQLRPRWFLHSVAPSKTGQGEGTIGWLVGPFLIVVGFIVAVFGGG